VSAIFIFFYAFWGGNFRLLISESYLAEQNDGDIQGEKDSLEEAKAGLAKLHKEVDKLGDEVAASEVLILRSQMIHD